MNFRFSDVTIGKTDAGNSFEFSPSSRTVLSTQPHNLADSAPYGNRFDILNRANDFKVHLALITIKSYELIMKLPRETECLTKTRFLNGKGSLPNCIVVQGLSKYRLTAPL